MNPEEMTPSQLLKLTVIVEGGLGLLACVLGLLLDFPPWRHLHWEALALVRGLVATGPMLVGFLVCLRWPIGPLRSLRTFSEQVIRPMFSQCSVGELACISLWAGVGEELFFRGFLQPALVEWTGSVWWGIAAASVVFGLCHPISVVYFVLVMGVGVYLGGVVFYTENLLDAMVAHAVYDFLALVVLTRGGTMDRNKVDH
jgi:membrane protease YdiL (CAAX protease family)